MKRLFLPVLVVLVMAAGCVPGGPITIVTSNQPSTAYIDSISPTEASLGETVAFDGHGTDPDGTVVAYRWRSSIDGALSAKATFETSALSEGEHTIYLKVQDNNGDWSEEVSSTVIVSEAAVAAPVVNAFGADPGSIVEGESSTLSWDVSGAATVSIDHRVGSVALTGSRTISPGTTTSYTLTATNATGALIAVATVVVSAAPPAEQTVTLDPVSTPKETGSIYSDGHIISDTLAGDTATNMSVRAYFSFDIESLAGVDVTSAQLTFTPLSIAGAPWSKLGGLWVDRVNYGERALHATDFVLGDTPLTGLLAAAPAVIDVTSAVQPAVDGGDPRFQVRTRFHVPVYGDDAEDSMRFLTATLTVIYLE